MKPNPLAPDPAASAAALSRGRTINDTIAKLQGDNPAMSYDAAWASAWKTHNAGNAFASPTEPSPGDMEDATGALGQGLAEKMISEAVDGAIQAALFVFNRSYGTEAEEKLRALPLFARLFDYQGGDKTANAARPGLPGPGTPHTPVTSHHRTTTSNAMPGAGSAAQPTAKQTAGAKFSAKVKELQTSSGYTYEYAWAQAQILYPEEYFTMCGVQGTGG